MIINERDIRHQLVVEAARRMMTAARTAPKAKGCDILEIALVDSSDDLNAIAEQMHREYESNGMQFLLRDADNILQGEALLLIGTRRQPQGLNCGYCGKPTCAQNPAPAPCAFNSIDVGIAVGSACAMAADMRVDTRVMFSAGHAAQALGLLPDCNQTLAIAIAGASKNPFFDRKPKEPQQ